MRRSARWRKSDRVRDPSRTNVCTSRLLSCAPEVDGGRVTRRLRKTSLPVRTKVAFCSGSSGFVPERVSRQPHYQYLYGLVAELSKVVAEIEQLAAAKHGTGSM